MDELHHYYCDKLFDQVCPIIEEMAQDSHMNNGTLLSVLVNVVCTAISVDASEEERLKRGLVFMSAYAEHLIMHGLNREMITKVFGFDPHLN